MARAGNHLPPYRLGLEYDPFEIPLQTHPIGWRVVTSSSRCRTMLSVAAQMALVETLLRHSSPHITELDGDTPDLSDVLCVVDPRPTPNRPQIDPKSALLYKPEGFSKMHFQKSLLYKPGGFINPR